MLMGYHMLITDMKIHPIYLKNVIELIVNFSSIFFFKLVFTLSFFMEMSTQSSALRNVITDW